jgi:hypothetical protein
MTSSLSSHNKKENRPGGEVQHEPARVAAGTIIVRLRWQLDDFTHACHSAPHADKNPSKSKSENGSSQGQNLALTGLFVPSSL